MRDASLTLDWADGTYAFRLGWAELEKLQEACDAGPYVVLQRLRTGTWRVGDVAHVVRLGLIGGGMTPVDALKKVRAYVEARPPAESLLPAQAILSAGVVGAPEEDDGSDRPAPNDADRVDDLPNGKIRMATVYGLGAAMGFTPQQVGAMSLWQFMAAVKGYAKANNPDDGKSLTAAEEDALWAAVAEG